MSESKEIGTGVCPVCNNDGARFSVSKKSLVVMTCNHRDCRCQLFARGDGCDELLRARVTARSEPKPAPEKIPLEVSITPTKPEPKPAPTAPSWGMLRGAKV